jgi:hypothetical protein
MGVFDARPIYRVASRSENLGVALDMPLSQFHNFTDQLQTGVLSTFGLGTAIRDFSTPRGVETPNPLVDTVANASPLLGDLIKGYEGARRLLGTPTTGTPISQAQYLGSEYYRKDIPWDPGMTTDRAASLATQYDIAQTRAFFGNKDPVTSFVGHLAGGLVDPINFVPIVGPWVKIAAESRLGFIMGHALLGASDAAINTAVFGALTASNRARYGDDVSWQTSVDNIAFSAVAGLLFGGGTAALARASGVRAARAEQTARMAQESMRNQLDARSALNDAVTSLVTDGDVRLSPSTASTIERMATDVADRRASVRALEAETASVTGTKPGEVAISPTGIRVAVRPEVVELSSLQPATGALQARNRVNNAVSNAQIEDIAINLDPARLMPNVDASQGAPLVGADNVVDSGNGRVGALARAYAAYPEKAAAYKAALEAHGFSTDGFQQPVLISRRVTDLSPEARAQFNAEANAATTSRMSAVELAQLDRQVFTKQVLDVLDNAPITAASNRAFVGRFLAGLPQNERASLLDVGGNLSADGVRRIENALVAAAYGDVDITAVRKFAEATDDNTRAIVGALSDVAGNWLRLRRAVQNGDVKPELDQTPELTEALRKLSTWREQAAREKRPVGTVIAEGMAQGDMLSGPVSLPTKLFVRSFYRDDNFTGAASRETIAARLSDLVDASLKAGEPDMLGEAHAATKLGVLKSVYNDISLDRFEAESVADGVAQVGGARGRPVAAAGEQAGGQPAGASRDGGSADVQGTAADAVTPAQQPSLDFGYRPVIDMQEPKPYPLTDGLDAAAARVGKREDMKALADQFGVDPETGDFAEMSDIEALRTAGRLTADDEAQLKAADKVAENADAWAETLKAATACVANSAG